MPSATASLGEYEVFYSFLNSRLILCKRRFQEDSRFCACPEAWIVPPGTATQTSNLHRPLMSTPPRWHSQIFYFAPNLGAGFLGSLWNRLQSGWKFPLYLRCPSIRNCCTSSHWIIINLLNFSWFLLTYLYKGYLLFLSSYFMMQLIGTMQSTSWRGLFPFEI